MASSRKAILASVAVTDRQMEALRLRRVGMSYENIGIELGISGQAAGELVKKAIRNTVKDDAEDVLTLELERLDLLYEAALPYAIGVPAQVVYDDNKAIGLIPRIDPDPAFMGRCLDIQARRARYIGLDAPVRMALIEAEAEKLAAQTGIPKEQIMKRANQLALVG